MDLFKTTLFLLTLICSFATYAQQNISKATPPTKVPILFEKIYIPDDFDSNDNVQIIGEGTYSNSCYREADTEIQIDHSSKVIHLDPKAYKYDGMCLMFTLPFDRVVNLGVLKVGTYKVIQGDKRSVLGQIRIRSTKTSEPDEHMYASVSQAFLSIQQATNVANVGGSFSMRCLKIKEIKSHIQSDVIVLLPIAEIDSSIPCDAGKFPFEDSVDLGPIQPGHYLFHVRTMNGKSINSVIDIH